MLEQLEIPGVLNPSLFRDSDIQDTSQKLSVSEIETFFENKYVYQNYIDPATHGACWKPYTGATRMLLSLVHTAKLRMLALSMLHEEIIAGYQI